MRKEGARGEEIACLYLKKNGFEILRRNFYVRGGEIDIIAASPRGQIIFVEVKLRRRDPIDHAALIPYIKRIRIARAARAWLSAYGPVLYRFDLILLVPRATGHRVIWYRNLSVA